MISFRGQGLPEHSRPSDPEPEPEAPSIIQGRKADHIMGDIERKTKLRRLVAKIRGREKRA